jgi:predicted DNA-binding antitoxin AbrB/MazE fold protein
MGTIMLYLICQPKEFPIGEKDKFYRSMAMVLKIIEAMYDGQVIRPDLPLKLEPNTRVRITVTPIQPAHDKKKSFLETARALKLQTPADLAENLDEYLYGGKITDEG